MSKHRTHRRWWDRLLSGVLCLALTLGLLPTAGLFQPAEAAHWAEPYARQLVEWGVMRAEWASDLNTAITRAEFVAMCNRAFGYTRLGDMPFVDVPSSEWYAEDINIAYNAGYFSGTSADQERPKAAPEDPLTREMAVVAASINLRLQETVGENLDFTDSHDLHEWSRGLIGAAVAEGVVKGRSDGSFCPFDNITRGEVAALLVGLVGTPVNHGGIHELGDVYGNVVISSSNVTLRDTVILGNLYITGGVDLGSVMLENVTVYGRIVIGGGGESEAARSSVILCNVEADEMVIDSLVGQFVTISAYGLTQIPSTYVRSDAFLEDACDAGYGLQYIELAGKSGTKLQLAGRIKEVRNKTPLSLLQLVEGTAETIIVDEYAVGSQLLVAINTRVDKLRLDAGTWVYGQGDIIDLEIGASDCVVDILPEHVWVRPGITAKVNGEEIGSAEADELSADPRLLPGYPNVTNLRPNQAVGQYAGNKPGTIYWAVSDRAKGSVTEEDLINNPAYGGNILRDGETPQSGNFPTNAREVNNWPITGLEPGNSYYISSILVDERGNRSPVKVISFTTPDDTRPAFVQEPYMSKVTCEVAQVATMVNKTCLLYWVLLPHGAAAPTARNFETSTFGGNYGYGSINVVKNVPVYIQVNATRLREKTGYDLYLWLNDLDGTLSSDVVKVLNKETQKPEDPSFITPDETPPVVTDVRQTNFNLPDGIEFTFEINEAPSTLYWAVVLETDNTFIKPTDDLNSQRIQMKVQNGTGAIVRGSKDADGAYTATEVKAGTGENNFNRLLDYDTYGTHTFKMYYMAKDAEGNYSEVKYIIIHTLDNDPPTVSLKFSSAKYDSPEDLAAGRKPQPQADSDLTLVFSEQVQGDDGEEAKNFVELYNEVERWEKQGLTDSDILLKNAKDALGKELEKHIQLYYMRYSWEKPGTELKPKGTNQGDEDFGWLDWREATVVLKDDGSVELKLISGKAVQLGGGMTYEFHFKDIYDCAYTPNALVVKDFNGNTIKEPEYLNFTTVYAQVVMSKNATVGTSISVVTGEDEEGQPLTETIRLDMCIDVMPQSTKNLADSVYWDLIMWCSTSAEFEIYRKMNSGNWVLAATVTYSTSSEGISWNAVRTDLTSAQKPEQAKYGLDQETTYTYGIHFTRVKNLVERNGKGGDPEVWGDTVTMEFSVVVGDSLNISNLSDAMEGSRNAYQQYVRGAGATLSEVGVYYDETNTMKSILDYKKEFVDKRAPEFISGYPSFTDVTSSSFTMNVMTNREGTIYYVVAPMTAAGTPTIGTVTGGTNGVAINAGNDGSTFVDQNGSQLTGAEWVEKLKALTAKTYIPTDGADRDAYTIVGTETVYNKDYIYFMTGGDAIDGIRGKYTSPSDDDVTGGGNTWPSNRYPTIKTFAPVPVGTAQQPIEISSLQPDTWYYVYILLQGGGKADDVVQVYRVKTAEAQPPVIVMSSTYTNATMTPNDYVDLNYILVSSTALPSFFNDKQNWCPTDCQHDPSDVCGGKQQTLLWAILNRTAGQNSATYFDLYATETQRGQVVGYVTGTNRSTSTGIIAEGKETFDPYTDSGGVYRDFIEELTPKEGEENANTYVLLAVAINHYTALVSTDYGYYGFGAADGLYLQKLDPPVFSDEGKSYIAITGTLRAYDNVNCTGTADTGWYNRTDNKIDSMYFKGSVSIGFSDPIYQVYRNGSTPVHRAIVTHGLSEDETGYGDDEIYVLDAIYTSLNKANAADSDKDSTKGTLSVNPSYTSAEGAQSMFVLDFTGMQNGDTIIFLIQGSIGGANPAGNTYQYRLRLTFSPFVTEYDLDPDDPDWVNGGELARKVGGFKVSLERISS